MQLKKIILELPWRKIISLYFLIRTVFFTRSRPSVPQDVDGVIIEGMTVNELTKKFSSIYFNGRWMFSYNYEGEDINIRRERFDDSYTYPYRQLHIRGFEQEDGVLLIAHEEVSPDGEDKFIGEDGSVGHAKAHIKEYEFNWNRGHNMMINTLEQLQIEYKEITKA